jgi:hypothetical protein
LKQITDFLKQGYIIYEFCVIYKENRLK